MALISYLREKQGWFFEQNRERWPEIEISIETALNQLILGAPINEVSWFQYVYAAKVLCDEFGEHLSNAEWSAGPRLSAWVTEVDAVLAAAGLEPERFAIGRHLMDRGMPPPLPRFEIPDYPSVGYLLKSELPSVNQWLGAINLPTETDAGVRDSIQEAAGWVYACVERRCDLICFAY
ncbi:MAG: hypothetical protein JNM56_25555 [Planctomycetia bacterium]|nr:hypothetical protein [Planctomycetia bacterium]